LWTPALHVRHKFPMRTASHCHPLPPVDGSPALRVLWGDPTPHGPSAALLAVGWAYLLPGIHGVSQVLDASLHAYHALKWTPADPREARQNASSVWASGALKPSPSALLPLRGCLTLWGVRSPLRSTWCPVDASTASFGLYLLRSCNTRYEWLVRPYSAGTCTLQETPSFAWRTNARPELLPEAEARHGRTLEAVSSRPLFGAGTDRNPAQGFLPSPFLSQGKPIPTQICLRMRTVLDTEQLGNPDKSLTQTGRRDRAP